MAALPPRPARRRAAAAAARRRRLGGLLLAGCAALSAAALPGRGACFGLAGAPPAPRRGPPPSARRAVAQKSEPVAEPVAGKKDDAALRQEVEDLEFETVKFNVAWTKMEEAKEAGSPEYEEFRREVVKQGEVVERLGGSLPGEMMTQEQAEERARKLTEDLTFQSLLEMSNDERWILAKRLGPAFPISLILSYTFYWTLNIPFIAYAYYTTVVNGDATMAVVMTSAYAVSIPFKPLVYIGAILGTRPTSEYVMPIFGKVFNLFKKLPE